MVGGDYFFRVSRNNASGLEETKNTRIFHAKVYSWSDLAGNYEALLLSANPTAQDGAIYRGAVTLSVTRTGVVSGRIQYTEALPVADSPLPSIRNYVPVVHSVTGRFSPAAGKPELWRLGPKGYPRSANTREEVTLEWNLSVTPPAVTAIVTDNVSGALGLDRGAWESRATCRRVLPSLLQLSAAQKQVVGRHVAGGDFSRSETGSPPAYLLLQVTSSGRLLWSSRRPGHSGSGASTLAEEDEHLFSAKFYEGQSISLTAARAKLSHSWAGRLVLSQLPPNARWSASVGSTELPSALELQSSCLSASGKTITFVPGDSNWSVIRSVQFAEGNGCDWKMASEVSDFIRTRPPMQFALQPTPAATAGPPTEQRWGATLFSRDAIKLLTPSNSEVAPPLTLFQLNRVSAEFTGIQSQSGMRPRGRLRGFVTDSSTRPKVHGLGWIETGELPFVTVRHWSLQTE